MIAALAEHFVSVLEEHQGLELVVRDGVWVAECECEAFEPDIGGLWDKAYAWHREHIAEYLVEVVTAAEEDPSTVEGGVSWENAAWRLGGH